jgi:Tol biopolymer transport system component
LAIDPETRQALGRPMNMNAPSGRGSAAPVWSPDGRMVAYYLHPPEGSSGMKLMVHDFQQGSDVELSSEWKRGFDWWPDSRSLLVVRESNDRRGIYRFEIGSGSSELLKDLGPEIGTTGRPFPSDERTVIYEMADEGRKGELSAIVSVDLATKEERVLYRFPRDLHVTCCAELSPDGRWIAFYERQGKSNLFYVIPASPDGTSDAIPRLVTSVPMANAVGTSLTWSGDSRYLLFSGRMVPDEHWGMWWVPREGGPLQELDLGPSLGGINLLGYVNASRDGKHIVFVGASAKPTGIWTLENFAAVLKTSQ